MIVTTEGRIFSVPAAITVLLNGAEVFSGRVGQGIPLDTVTDLLTFTWNGAKIGDTASCSISVTSGVISVGSCFGESEIKEDMRTNILINGQAPEEPATDMGFSIDDWQGWFFEISAGETITFTLNNKHG